MGSASIPIRGTRGETEALSPVAMPHEPMQIGPYRILLVIARGGMGTVYRARVVVSCEVPMGTEVAIKLLRSFGSREERLRFTREAGYLQSLRHPGIVRVLDAGEYEGQPYLVMPLIDGVTLQDLLVEQHRLGEYETAEIAIQALEALHTAHLAGILHRDVKPANIMLTEESGVKLVDFGLAQRLDGQSNLTATGAVVGTPAYMSPEQAAGERNDVGRRSDVYSLGACCYEMLTGRQPFEAENPVALLRVVTDEPLILPSVFRKELHHDLETIILKAMAKHPGDRYPSAELMAEDLRRFRQGLPVRTRRPGPWRGILRSAWRHRTAITAIALVLFLAAGTVALALRATLRQNQAQNTTPVQPDLTADWVSEFRADAKTPLAWRPYAPFGAETELCTVGAVAGPVRLEVTAEILNDQTFLELLICDRDIGRGYRLRFAAQPEQAAMLTLLREDKVVASRPLSPQIPGRVFTLSLERMEDSVVCNLDGESALVFVDLAPIEGSDADGIHLARRLSTVTLHSLHLERQRTGLYVSALAPADSLRQDGRYARAIQAYETFVRDNPESPLVRDARFRIALCHEALHDYAQALKAYLEVARVYRDHPHHAMAAFFRAWSCSVQLGLYQEAEQYFAAIRRSHDLPTLLASVPEDVINTLIADYASRAAQLASDEPQRAVDLYTTGADLAAYLALETRERSLRYAAADLLLGMQRPEATVDHLRTSTIPAADPERLLRLGHARRLQGKTSEAVAAYTAIIESEPQSLTAQWARFWVGDLMLDAESADAAELWWESSVSSEDLPGRLMRHLMHGNRPMSLPEEDAAIVEYANARLAFIRGLEQQYRERLANTISLAPAHLWPVPLARALSARD